jgi:hypothetical protein
VTQDGGCGALLCVVLVFVYAERVGSFLALLAAALILFSLVRLAEHPLAVPNGLADLTRGRCRAVLALDRADGRGDVAACLLLGLALTSSGLGVVVALGAPSSCCCNGDATTLGSSLRQPLCMGCGGTAMPTTCLAKILRRAALRHRGGAGCPQRPGRLGGDAVPYSSGALLDWGPPLLIAAAALVVWRLAHLKRVSPRVVTLLITPGAVLGSHCAKPRGAWAPVYKLLPLCRRAGVSRPDTRADVQLTVPPSGVTLRRRRPNALAPARRAYEPCSVCGLG